MHLAKPQNSVYNLSVMSFVLKGGFPVDNEKRKRVDPVVLQTTGYVAVWVLGLSVLMQLVFLLIGKWDVTVLWGNLLSAAAAIGNFFLMGYTVQKAVSKEEKQAKTLVSLSQTGRYLLLLAVAALGAALPCFHTWAVLIPLLFPTIAVRLKPLFDKKKGGEDNL